MHKFFWYINRGRSMSPAEISFRFLQSLRHMAERFYRGRKSDPFKNVIPTKKVLPDYALDQKVRFPEIIHIFGIPFNYTEPVNWHRDVFSGRDFPRIYARSIEIRTSEYGSAKAVWEINRMLFLPWLCIDYRSTGDRSYLTLFRDLIISWQSQNPYLTGVNWYSNIEINIRLINWVICWEILEAERLAESDPEFRRFMLENWLPLIHLHCRYSYSNPSFFSSANNHLIAEYSGLFLASLKWHFPESLKWQKYARKGLEKEILKQHSPNGINREEAAEYIQFITDFFLLPFIAARNTGNDFSAGYGSMLCKIVHYIHSFTDSVFHIPQYGDEDDGKVILTDAAETFNNFRSLLISGALLFNDETLLDGIHEPDVKNILLFGTDGREKLSRWLSSSPPVRHSQNVAFYEEEGHYIIKDILKGGKELYLHIDAAPLGYLKIAGHGHADALSFILHLNGHPFFIDSGTYTYHSEPEFRNYFIGTLAHNTVRINRCNQAISGGPTLWLSHYSVKREKVSKDNNCVRIVAEHDGYRSKQVIHKREFLYNRNEKSIAITDTLILLKNIKTQVEIPFHLHPDVKVTGIDPGKQFMLEHHEGSIHLRTDPQLIYQVRDGESNPVLGWYSPSFYKKVPANVLYASVTISETTIFRSEIKVVNN